MRIAYEVEVGWDVTVRLDVDIPDGDLEGLVGDDRDEAIKARVQKDFEARVEWKFASQG